jgi:hypothetical protein
MAKVTNISNGPRGAYLDGQLVMADPGQTVEADDYADEWFAKGAQSLSDLKKADLAAICDAENIAHDGDDSRAELIAKIEASRATAP